MTSTRRDQLKLKQQEKDMSNKFTVSDFQAEIAHTMHKPYLRIKGVTLPTNQWEKRMVNDSANFTAKKLLNSVTYEVSENVVKDTEKKIKKATGRQMVTNFWEARIPHDEMFMGWQIPSPPDMDSEVAKQQAFEGWWITKIHREQILTLGIDSSMIQPETYYRYSYYFGQANVGAERLTITHLPTAIANAAYSDDVQDKPWLNYESEYDNGYRDDTGLSIYEMFKRIFLVPRIGFFDPVTGNYGVDYKNWIHSLSFDEQRMISQITAMPPAFPEGEGGFNPRVGAAKFLGLTVEDNKAYALSMLDSFPKLIAFIAAQNFSWVFTEPVCRGKHTKSVSSRMRPRNRHYKLEIKLPKEKQVVEGKQTQRTREFGNALHEVKGHKREYKDGRTVWIKAHQRGDKKFGIVTKDYVLTKDKKNDYRH
tara:strand:+ start:179 stop:1444 length:1266 start_codon:yes stop_codon:yes gene_type:complete